MGGWGFQTVEPWGLLGETLGITASLQGSHCGCHVAWHGAVVRDVQGLCRHCSALLHAAACSAKGSTNNLPLKQLRFIIEATIDHNCYAWLVLAVFSSQE